MEFRKILHLFENFSQKKSFGKILKIRAVWFASLCLVLIIAQDQVNLPIFKFKNDIITALQTNNVIVVAGDTGCGVNIR